MMNIREIEEKKPLNFKFRYCNHLFNSTGMFELVQRSQAADY